MNEGTHFWIMTHQTLGRISTDGGTLTPRPGETRLDLFKQLRGELSAGEENVVLFFDIQPNAF